MIGEGWTLRKSAFLLVAAATFGVGAACSSNHRIESNSSGKRTAADTSPGAATVFGGEISLDAYSSHSTDGHTMVDLKWSALKKPTTDYNVFIHALDRSGGILFQFDHPLKNGAGQMTSDWTASESVTDEFLAIPPPSQSPGAYTLRLGVFVPNPMKILQITRSGFPQPKDGWNDHSVVIENVDCK